MKHLPRTPAVAEPEQPQPEVIITHVKRLHDGDRYVSFIQVETAMFVPGDLVSVTIRPAEETPP